MSSSINDLERTSGIKEPVYTKLDLINIIYTIKGTYLEIDARKLYRRRDFYKMNPSELNWKINNSELDELYKLNCIKDKSSMTIEIDLYGKKEIEGQKIYLFGECKIKKRKIDLKSVRCFIKKSSIIAKYKLEIDEKTSNKKPSFHLSIISLKGFPEKSKIHKLIEKHWNLGLNLLKYKDKIELIDGEHFINELRRNNIPAYIYRKITEI